MDTALITGYDADDVLLEKTRAMCDHTGIFGTIELWFNQEPKPTSIKVECFDTADTCIHSYLITHTT